MVHTQGALWNLCAVLFCCALGRHCFAHLASATPSQPDNDYLGPDVLHIHVSDLGNTGLGGVQYASHDVHIEVRGLWHERRKGRETGLCKLAMCTLVWAGVRWLMLCMQTDDSCLWRGLGPGLGWTSALCGLCCRQAFWCAVPTISTVHALYARPFRVPREHSVQAHAKTTVAGTRSHTLEHPDCCFLPTRPSLLLPAVICPDS